MQIGIVGLGNMGGPIADWVRQGGFSLVLHDIRRDLASPLLDKGAAWADTPSELATKCDVIFLCVPGPAEMQAVALGANGILEGIQREAVCVDLTTNTPEVVRRVGALLKDRHAHMLDAPLDGGREGALEGKLNLFVGGDEAVLQRVQPVLKTFTKNVVWVGDLGAGSVTKLVHNALAMSIDLVLAECLTLGVKAGVALPRLVDAFRQGCIISENMSFQKRLPATLFRGDFAARFALKLAYKDFRLANDLAVHAGVPTRLLDLCLLEFQEAMDRGWGDQDRTISSTLQEERAGVKLRLAEVGADPRTASEP